MINGKKYTLNNGIVVGCVRANFGQVRVISVPRSLNTNWKCGETRSIKNCLGNGYEVRYEHNVEDYSKSESNNTKQQEKVQEKVTENKDSIDLIMANAASNFANIISKSLGTSVLGVGINGNTGVMFMFGSDN